MKKTIKNNLLFIFILAVCLGFTANVFAFNGTKTFFREIVTTSVKQASVPTVSKQQAYVIAADLSFASFSLLSFGLLTDVGETRIMYGNDWVDHLILSPISLTAAEMDLGLGFTPEATWYGTIVRRSKRNVLHPTVFNTKWYSFLDSSEEIDFLTLINNAVPDIMRLIQMGFQEGGKQGAIKNFLVSQRIISDVMAEGLKRISKSPNEKYYDELNAMLLMSEAIYYFMTNLADASVGSYSALTESEILPAIPIEYHGRSILEIVKDHIIMPWRSMELIRDRLTIEDLNVTPEVAAIFIPFDNALIRIAGKYLNGNKTDEEIQELLTGVIERIIYTKKLLGLIPDETQFLLSEEGPAKYLEFLNRTAIETAIATGKITGKTPRRF